MKFRLTYDGLVLSSQPMPSNPDANLSAKQVRLATNKQAIRKKFHKQLRFLWEENPVLRNLKYCETCGISRDLVSHPTSVGFGSHKLRDVRDYITDQFQRFEKFRFCPLVCEEFDLLCSIGILILRRSSGGVFEGGDLDNRVKTITDALKMPGQRRELGDHDKPALSEDPFYVLLQDDKQVSGFAVESDMLLREKRKGDEDDRIAKVIVSVELRPASPTFFNLSFA